MTVSNPLKESWRTNQDKSVYLEEKAAVSSTQCNVKLNNDVVPMFYTQSGFTWFYCLFPLEGDLVHMMLALQFYFHRDHPCMGGKVFRTKHKVILIASKTIWQLLKKLQIHRKYQAENHPPQYNLGLVTLRQIDKNSKSCIDLQNNIEQNNKCIYEQNIKILKRHHNIQLNTTVEYNMTSLASCSLYHSMCSHVI